MSKSNRKCGSKLSLLTPNGQVSTSALNVLQLLHFTNQAKLHEMTLDWTHNPKVAGSNPAPATTTLRKQATERWLFLLGLRG